MSVKVHEAFSIDSFQDRLLWWDDFLGDQIQDEWRVAGTGTCVVVDAQTGGIVRITTGAIATNTQLLDWGNIRSLHVTKKVSYEFRLKLNQLTQRNVWCALYFGGNDYIMFYNPAAAFTVNWFIYCRNGGITTNQDSGILADTDYHIFRIECFPTDEVHFYIDGVECANSPLTTNIPDDAGDFLQPYFFLVTSEDATKSIDVDYCVARQEI